MPTPSPTNMPTSMPSPSPTKTPVTNLPTVTTFPTPSPSPAPTNMPTSMPTPSPTMTPTIFSACLMVNSTEAANFEGTYSITGVRYNEHWHWVVKSYKGTPGQEIYYEKSGTFAGYWIIYGQDGVF